MVFKPVPCKTRWEGILACLWIVLIDLLLLIWAAHRTTDRIRFLLFLFLVASVPLLLHLLYRTWSIYSLEYWVDRNAITICWANVRQIIPLHLIQRMIQGNVQESTKPGWQHWPGPYLRAAQAPSLRNVQLLASRPLEECLLLDLGERVFAIAPLDEADFLATVQERFRMGPAVQIKLARTYDTFLPRFFEESQAGLLLLGVGLFGVLALFGLLMVRFPGLPDQLPFHYATTGAPDVIRGKSALFILPAIGLLAWLINGLWGLWMVYRKQMVGAYMLWGGAIIVQLCSFFALKSLLP